MEIKGKTMKQETICIKKDCYFGYTEDRIKKFEKRDWILEDQLKDFKKGLVCQTGHDLITINENEDFYNWKRYPMTEEEIRESEKEFFSGQELEDHVKYLLDIQEKYPKNSADDVWILKATRDDKFISYMARNATKKHIVTKVDRIDYDRYLKYDQLNNMDLQYWTARASSICKYNNKFVWDRPSSYNDPVYDRELAENERINKAICMNCLKKAS